MSLIYQPNATHDPELRSWVESANPLTTDFPIQNLPFGVFYRKGQPQETARIGVAIGDSVLDLSSCVECGLLGEAYLRWCAAPHLNVFLALGPHIWSDIRQQLSVLLQPDSPAKQYAERILIAQSDVDMLLPATIGDYTDAYASIDHASQVGRLFRPDAPLLPNYKYVPIAYHGRASSIILHGADIVRPAGQLQDGTDAPRFEPSRRLDYEAEIGLLIGPGNKLGHPISVSMAEQHMFGLCLVQDWSARDIQRWEYQPLGPFLSKSFATSMSPWVVTTEALAPFRIPAYQRPATDPQPLPYLYDVHDQQYGGFAITIDVYIQSEDMRMMNIPAQCISRSSMASMYWTFAPIVAHHSSNGCNLRPGDLSASGTISGPHAGEQGCLLELTRGGASVLTLTNGETRSFLIDGDEVRMLAYATHPQFRRIGLGSCVGRIIQNGI